MPPRRKTIQPEVPQARTVSVVVPWRATPDREPAWAWLRDRWATEHPTWELIEGACPDGEWRKGAAVAEGVARARGDVLVVADADVWCDGVAEAVNAVHAGAGWAKPHHLLIRLTQRATDALLAGGPFPPPRDGFTYAERPYIGVPGGGMVVLRRDDYWRVPIDPRFYGWGQEDEAWAVALRLLLGREWKGTADMWHLHHDRPARMSRFTGNSAGAALHRRYRAAKSSPRTMAALIAESVPA